MRYGRCFSLLPFGKMPPLPWGGIHTAPLTQVHDRVRARFPPYEKKKSERYGSDFFLLVRETGEERKTVDDCFSRTKSTKQGKIEESSAFPKILTMRLYWGTFKSRGEGGGRPTATFFCYTPFSKRKKPQLNLGSIKGFSGAGNGT